MKDLLAAPIGIANDPATESGAGDERQSRLEVSQLLGDLAASTLFSVGRRFCKRFESYLGVAVGAKKKGISTHDMSNRRK